MKITDEFLETIGACVEGREWVNSHHLNAEARPLIEAMLTHRFDWANWLLVRILDDRQKIVYVIYAAEQVLEIYEREYPGDARPRMAIEAAKESLKNPSGIYAGIGAIYAAIYAGIGTTHVSSYAGIYTGIYADIGAAARAACATADAVACAAYATDTADTAELKTKIIMYGLSLLPQDDVQEVTHV